MGKTIQAELPSRLVEDAQAFVDNGWAGSVNELLADALRRYLESHRDEIRIRPARRSLSGVLSKFAQFTPGFMDQGRGDHEQIERDTLLIKRARVE